MIHTPHGFDKNYIKQILLQRNLEEKWKKCLEFAFDRILNDSNKGEVANKRKQLSNYLNEYIIEPTQIRNKIAHGQWSVCFNSDNTAINNDLTKIIQNLDCVKIYRLFEIYNKFAECVEDLIESPHKAHYRYYYPKIEELKSYIDKTKDYTLDSKRELLKSSPKYRNKEKRSIKQLIKLVLFSRCRRAPASMGFFLSSSDNHISLLVIKHIKKLMYGFFFIALISSVKAIVINSSAFS